MHGQQNVKKIYIYFACFIWVQNSVSHTEGEIQVEGVREEGTEENIWVKVDRGNWGAEKTSSCGAS